MKRVIHPKQYIIARLQNIQMGIQSTDLGVFNNRTYIIYIPAIAGQRKQRLPDYQLSSGMFSRRLGADL